MFIQSLSACIGIHPGRVDPATPMEKHGDVSLVVTFIGFAAQAKPVRFESVGASARHTLPPFGFNPGDATAEVY